MREICGDVAQTGAAVGKMDAAAQPLTVAEAMGVIEDLESAIVRALQAHARTSNVVGAGGYDPALADNASAALREVYDRAAQLANAAGARHRGYES